MRLNEVVQCPAGKASVNGGFQFEDPTITTEGPYHRIAGGPEGADWRVQYDSIVGVIDDYVALTLWAICVDA